MKLELIECSETSAYKIQALWNHPKEGIQHSEHGESLKSKLCYRKFVGGVGKLSGDVASCSYSVRTVTCRCYPSVNCT